ncbi:hypothetical protein [Alteromonas sp. a30]|uniref:hypothetical protein n=1 Tax=Alteromonas sp. a30 TaxID=2730917 RepID=UPI0022831B66|nr:hypothetical protein [Alteromonas sp. a30]MCY7294911.1 hypothetical protein [Alteromonas sp. a30]
MFQQFTKPFNVGKLKPVCESTNFNVYYDADNGIVQLFNQGVPFISVEKIKHRNDALFQSYGQVLTCDEAVLRSKDNRFGLSYQGVKAESLLDHFRRSPHKFEAYCEQLALNHIRILAMEGIDSFPKQAQVLAEKIKRADIPDEQKQRVLNVFQSMPVGNKVCHGDYLPEILFFNGEGYEVTCFHDICVGEPLSDIARTYIMLKYGWFAETFFGFRWFGSLLAKWNADTYLDYCKKQIEIDDTEFDKWILINATARISEDVVESPRLKKLVLDMLKTHKAD